MDEPPDNAAGACPSIEGARLRLVGRFASVSRRETAAAVRRRGATIDEERPEWVVVGEEATDADRAEAAAAAREVGAELVTECELWRRLGLVDDSAGVRRLYSPAMLSELVGAPVAAIRRWTRRGVLRPASRVNRLAYFDFEEARVAQLLAELLRRRGSLVAVDRVVDRLNQTYGRLDRPLADLPLAVVDGELMLRGSDSLSESTGQRRFEFEPTAESDDDSGVAVIRLPGQATETPRSFRDRAWDLSEEGRFDEAVEAWRLAMFESPPTADDHFALAEWLYRDHQPLAARERYYATLELDGEYLEARVGLGCVLRELGDEELAVAAFRGALEQHEPFADAHYHLAETLRRGGDHRGAEPHWRRLLEIAPESPWADAARAALGEPAAGPG